MEAYKKHLIEIKNEEYIFRYRQDSLLNRFKSIKKSSESSSMAKVSKGVTEDYFFDYLKSSLPYDIFQNHALKFPNSEKGYFPDIVLHDRDTNLMIDIEIDEPYIGSTRDPIHFDLCGDDARDQYFVKNGWIVIRFSEEQIVKQTSMCVDFVEYIINSLINVSNSGRVNFFSELITKYSDYHSLIKRGWDKDEAHRMAFTRYRNSYLGFDFIEKLSSERPLEIS